MTIGHGTVPSGAVACLMAAEAAKACGVGAAGVAVCGKLRSPGVACGCLRAIGKGTRQHALIAGKTGSNANNS